MKLLEHYPFPKRNPQFKDDDIICSYSKSKVYDNAYQEKWFKIKTDTLTLTYKLQYLNLESELIKSFLFVHPTEINRKTYSIKFAEIIKGSANLYEIICKDLYKKYFDYDTTNKINIYYYLSLEKFLNLSNMEVIPILIGDKLKKSSELFKPFKKLSTWNKNTKIKPGNIPGWWNAYNKIKHSNIGLKKYATLENSIASLAAIYLLIYKIYGLGVIYGDLFSPKHQIINVKTSELFSIKYKN